MVHVFQYALNTCPWTINHKADDDLYVAYRSVEWWVGALSTHRASISSPPCHCALPTSYWGKALAQWCLVSKFDNGEKSFRTMVPGDKNLTMVKNCRNAERVWDKLHHLKTKWTMKQTCRTPVCQVEEKGIERGIHPTELQMLCILFYVLFLSSFVIGEERRTTRAHPREWICHVLCVCIWPYDIW